MAPESSPTPSSSGAEPRSGQVARRVVRMGKYEVISHIATGGMGAVYKARDLEEQRDVALKILPPDMAAKPAMLERFRREARNAGKLNHPHIVTLFEFGEINNTYFLAMEFIEGVDLHDHVKKKGTLDPEEARQIILQATRALHHADQNNIVHRDIKPSNFLLTRKNNRLHVKLTDFGLAREVTADEYRVTRAGTTVGTIDYMSPEQAKDSSAADIRSDLYSLGCTWYHLLVGTAPFSEGGLGERLIKIMSEQPPDPREINPRISDETWTTLSRLLAKDPADRFQTPEELIEELVALEGRAAARPRAQRAEKARKPRRRPRSDEDTAAEAPSTIADARSNRILVIAAGVVAAMVVLGLVLLFVLPRRRSPNDDHTVHPPVVLPGPVLIDPPIIGPIVKPPDTKGKTNDPVKPIKPDKRTWPTLAGSSVKRDLAALRAEVDAPWARAVLPATDAFVAQIRRAGDASPSSFRSLHEACAAAPAGKPIVLEIHDNGPLFETPFQVEGRDLTIRAAEGYQPFLVWDLAETLALRKKNRQEDQPLTFVRVQRGRLTVEGVELAWRWPDTLASPATLFDVQDGETSLRRCILSGAGKPRGGVTLVRFHSTREGGRCRLQRCHTRGAGLNMLDLNAPGAEVLLDGCLLVGGQPSLLRLIAAEKNGPSVRIVRSTLICAQTLMEVKPATPLDRNPTLTCLCWDSLLARSSPGEGGELLALREGVETRNMKWQAVNTLYAGWKRLQEGGGRGISSDDLATWQREWQRIDGDAVAREPWPDQQFNEPAILPVGTYQPDKAVGYASSVNPEKPLGCDLAALPVARDTWLTAFLEPSVMVLEAPSEGMPEIPNPGDGKFHGARLDLADVDLGAYLAQAQTRMGLGPRVVMHLTGKGERITSPLRVKGSSLVLHFEEPADKDTQRLVLRLGGTPPSSPVPMVDVEDGTLEIYNGTLRIPEIDTMRVSHVLRVRGGDVKLYHTRVEGPHHVIPTGYQGAISLGGSGDPSGEKAHGCSLNECIVLSSRAAILLEGVGCRLLVRQSLVVSNTSALALLPGKACKGRANMQCVLENVTFAARQSVVLLGDIAPNCLVTEPIQVQARDCAYLNPFPARSGRAGLLLWEGNAFPRGLLLWQGEGAAFDHRLYFTAWAAQSPLPDRKEGYRPWRTLWGSQAGRAPRAELMLVQVFDTSRWQLERLSLRMKDPPGAALDRLGILPRKPPR